MFILATTNCPISKASQCLRIEIGNCVAASLGEISLKFYGVCLVWVLASNEQTHKWVILCDL